VYEVILLLSLHYLALGFELELYGPDDLPMTYWYLDYLSQRRIQHFRWVNRARSVFLASSAASSAAASASSSSAASGGGKKSTGGAARKGKGKGGAASSAGAASAEAAADAPLSLPLQRVELRQNLARALLRVRKEKPALLILFLLGIIFY
jgi:hypothetical protein